MTMSMAVDHKQRAGIRRTALIVGGIAFVIFVLFFVKQFFWH